MPKNRFTDRIIAQVDPKNPSAETVAAVLAQARSTIFSMGHLLDVPAAERNQIAQAAQPMFDAIAKSPDPGKESYVQFSEQLNKLHGLDEGSPDILKHTILTAIISGIRHAVGPKSVKFGTPS